MDGILLRQPVNDIRRLAGHAGQAAHALRHDAEAGGHVAQRCAGEGGIRLEDIQRLVKIIRSLAQILCGIAQGIQTRLNGGIAGTDVAGVEAQLIQNIFQIAQLVAHIAKCAGHAGKGRSHLGIALLRNEVGGVAQQRADLRGQACHVAHGAGDLLAGGSQLAVIGQQRGAPQQTQAGGQQLHLAAHAGTQREDAHGGIRYLQQGDGCFDVIVHRVTGHAGITAQNGTDGAAQTAVVLARQRGDQVVQTLADLLQTLFAGIQRVAGLVRAGRSLGQCRGGGQHLGRHLRGDPLELAHGGGHLIQCVDTRVHHGLQPGKCIGDEVARAVHLVRHFVKVIASLLLQTAGCLHGSVHLRVQGVEVGIEEVGAAVHVIGRAVDHGVQRVQLGAQTVDGALVQVQLHIGLCLAGNAAHVLAALYQALVDTAGDQAIGPAHDAAHVIAYMGIAHVARVGTAEDQAGGAACNAAGIRGDIGDVIAQVIAHILLDQLQKGGREALHIEGGLLILGVDGPHIGAAGDDTEVVAHDAAGGIRTADHGTGGAVVDGSARLIAAHQTARLLLAVDSTGERAVDDGAVVGAHQTACGLLGTSGIDHTLDGKVLNGTTLFQDAEEAGWRISPYEADIRDGVAVALERAAERRNGGPLRILQREVFLQDHGLAFGPLIKAAFVGKGQQVRNTVDVNGIRRRGVGRKYRQRRRSRQHQCQQRSGQAVQQPGAARRRLIRPHGSRFHPAPPVRFYQKER